MDTVTIEDLCEAADMPLWAMIAALEATVMYADKYVQAMNYMELPVERTKDLLAALKRHAEAKDEMQ